MPVLTALAVVAAAAVAGVAAAAVAAHVLLKRDPAVPFIAYLVLQLFSGWFHYVHLPTGTDRAVLLLGFLGLWLRRREVGLWHLVRLRGVHVALAAIAVIAVGSAIVHQTLFTRLGFFSITDRLGLIPFAYFVLGPVLFRTEHSRRLLVGTLVVIGAYLGWTSLMEGLHVDALVFPSYINNPALGIQFGRARGPFLEATANGLGLVDSAVAAAVGLTIWRGAWIRRGLFVVIGVCLLGTVFTVTREVWIGTVLAIVGGMLAVPGLRKWLVPALALSTIAVVGFLGADPALLAKAQGRAASQSPIWDRLNTSFAALRAWEAHPLFGVGWQRFIQIGYKYQREALTYPITVRYLEVHNVFLSHLAELGLVGIVAYLAALWLAVGLPSLERAARVMEPWRIGLLAIALDWLVVANFSPLAPSYPNLMLWAWAGVVLAGPAMPPWRETRGPVGSPTSAVPAVASAAST